MAHRQEAQDLDPLAAGPIEQQDRDDVPGYGERREDPELGERVVQQGRVRVEQGEDLRGGDRIAVVAEVQQEPRPRRPDQPQQQLAVPDQHPEAFHDPLRDSRYGLGSGPAGLVRAGRLCDRGGCLPGRAASQCETAASRGSGAGGRRRPGPGSRRARAGSARWRCQRADDQARALHCEDQPHHPAPGPAARVLAHDRCRHRIVSADADAKDRTAASRNA